MSSVMGSLSVYSMIGKTPVVLPTCEWARRTAGSMTRAVMPGAVLHLAADDHAPERVRARRDKGGTGRRPCGPRWPGRWRR